MLVRSQAVKYPSILNSSQGVQKDTIRKQRISEILSDEFWRSKVGITDEIIALTESNGNESKSDPKQALKLLTASCDCSSRKQGQRALSIKIKERRKVRLVEELDQKYAGRIAQIGRAPPSNHSRPISADDIQKAKMRAMFMQHKYGKSDSSENKKIEDSKDLPASQPERILLPSRIMQLEQIDTEEKKQAENLPRGSETPVDTLSTEALQKVLLERLKRSQFQWQTPPEMKIDSSWRVGEADSSKELVVQTQRIRREKETFYSSKCDIPSDPKEPWDIEMDFDDSLTPEIPIEQPPDSDAVEEPTDPSVDAQAIPDYTPVALPAPPPTTSHGNLAVPDFELLAVLLKNPELVFALTSGQGKNLTSDERVMLLDMIKHSSVAVSTSMTGMSTSTSHEKSKDPVPMSLPSPTPPSDVERVAGWRSQFSGAVRHSVPTLTHTPLPTVVMLPAQAELQSVPQTVAVSSLTCQQMPSPALSQHIQPSGYAVPQRLNTYYHNSLPMPVSSQPTFPPPKRRSQSLMISDPSLSCGDANTEWCEWRDMMPESPPNTEDFALQRSPRFGASVRDIYPTHQGRSTGRVEISGRSRHPEGTTSRSSEFRHGHSGSHAESRERGWNQRHELSRRQSLGYHDQYRSSNGSGGRWRDRDRRK